MRMCRCCGNLVPSQVLLGNSSFNTGNSISAGLPSYVRNRIKSIAEIWIAAELRSPSSHANGPLRRAVFLHTEAPHSASLPGLTRASMKRRVEDSATQVRNWRVAS